MSQVVVVLRRQDDPMSPCHVAIYTLETADYDSNRGVVVLTEEGGTVEVLVEPSGSVQVLADAAGLRDLARWCLALADAHAPDGVHIHMDPGSFLLADTSVPLMIGRHEAVSRG